MSNATLDAALKADASGFVKGMREAETSLEKFLVAAEGVGRGVQIAGNVVDGMAQKVRSAGKVMAGIGVATGVGMGLAIKNAAAFQAEMLNVQSILQGSAAELSEVKGGITGLSRELPQTANDLARGMYDVASSGFASAEGLYVLDAAAVSASAGLTQTAVAARAITAVLNAYGMEAGAAKDVSDILFQTVNLGVVTFEELAMSVGEWVSMAAAAGVAADEAAAAIAAMTLSGINSAEAATSLSRLLQEFINPSESLTEAAKAMGYESAGAMLNVMGLEQTMQALRVETGGTAEAFLDLFPEIRAARGALALAAADGQNYAEVAASITDANARSGAAQEAFNVQVQGLGMQLQILSNNFSDFSRMMYDGFVGPLTWGAQVLNEFFAILQELPGPIQWLIGGISGVTAALAIGAGLILTWMAHAVVWKGIMMLLSSQLANLAGIMTGLKLHAAAKGFTLLSSGAAKAGKSFGPLGASIKAVTGAMAGLRAMGLGGVATFIKLGGGVLALGTALWTLKNMSEAAEEAGRAAAEQFAAGFETDSIEDLTLKYDGLLARVEEVGSSVGLTDPFGGRSSGEKNRLWEEADDTAVAIQRLRDLAGSVLIEAKGLEDLQFGSEDWDNVAAGIWQAEDALNEYDGLARSAKNATVDWLLEAAQARGLDFSAITDLENISTSQLEQMGGELGDLYRDLTASSAEAEVTQRAFAELGDEFQTASEKMDALQDAFDAFIQGELGLEEATDNVNETLNDLYQTTQDLRDAGTLEEAMDLGSFHEDAIALRGDMRGMLDDVTAQTVAWAREQDNLTGTDLRRYLQDQAADLREVGKEMGWTNEFTEHYVGLIEDIANHPDILTQFNSNVESQTTEVGKYLASIGLADTQIETYMKLRANEGQETADTYLETLGLIDGFDPEVYVVAKSQDAKAAIDELISSTNRLDEEDYVAIVDLLINGSDDLDKALNDLGIAEAEWEALVEVAGVETEEEAIALLNTSLENLDEEEAIPSVLLDTTEFDSKYNEITAKLRALRVATMVSAGAPGDGTGWGGIGTPQVAEDRAMGGINRNPMVTNRPILWGEAGPEAYIPLGADKRGAAMKLWAEVGQMFGVRGMASGGYTRKPITGGQRFGGRFRPEDGDDGTGGSGSGSGGSSSGSKKSNLDFDAMFSILQNMYELGDLTPAQYDEMLNDILATQKKYSKNYMTVWNEIISVDDEVLNHKEEWIQMVMDIQSRMFEVGDLSEDDYLKFLRKRMSETVKYSQEWFDVWSEIQAIEDDRKQREEEALEEERRVEAAKHEVGVLSNKEYLKILRDRLAGLEKFSEEWMETWREIQGIEEEVLQDTKDKNTSNRFSDISGSGFLSTSQVLGYYERMARQAQEWLTIVNGLATAGVSGTIIQDLLSAGPSSLPLAKALRRIYESGQMGALSGSLNTISAIDNYVEKKIGVHTSGPLVPEGGKVGGVTFTGDMYFTGPQTVKQFSNEVDFQLGMN